MSINNRKRFETVFGFQFVHMNDENEFQIVNTFERIGNELHALNQYLYDV